MDQTMLSSQWSKRVCQDGQAGYIRPPVRRHTSVLVVAPREGHSLATGRVSPHIGRDAECCLRTHELPGVGDRYGTLDEDEDDDVWR